MTGAVVALVLTALAVGFLGSTVFGIDGPCLAGGYAGIGTTTPGLAAAQTSSPDPAQPATGYAIGYPLAVVLTILFVTGVAAVRNRPSRRTPGSGLPAELITRTADVTRPVRRADVPGAAGVEALSTPAPAHLHDRRDAVDYRRVLLTTPDLAGRTVAELGLGDPPGVLPLPSGRLVRGRGLRRPLPEGPAPTYAVHLLGRTPPEVPWESVGLRRPDFRLPADRDTARTVLAEAWERAAGERVEVACGGGRGRTGTVLAGLAVLDGVPAGETVAYVRRHYDRHAVETPWQRRYVRRFTG